MAMSGGSKLLEGDATHEDVLIKAHVKSCIGVITTLADDAANVFVALTVKELNPQAHIVSRASNESAISKLMTAGVDKVVMPNQIGGRKMAKILTKPVLVEFLDLITGQGDSRLNLQEIECDRQPGLIGKSLADLKIKAQTGVLVLGYRDKDDKFHFNPGAGKIISNSEILFILGSTDQLKKFEELYL